jgi:hypothetical protein
MIWFSVRQETAEVCGPRLINRIRGWAYLKCIRLSSHYRFIKFAPDVAACVAVTVSGGWLLFHGNLGSLANNRGNALTFLLTAWHCSMRLENYFFVHKHV